MEPSLFRFEDYGRLSWQRKYGVSSPGIHSKVIVLFQVRVPPTPRTLYHLARLNVVHHVMYARYRYPRYGRAVHRVTAGIERGLHALRRPR